VKGVGRSAPKEEGGGNLRFMASRYGSTQHNGVNNGDFLPTPPLTGSRRRTHAFHSEEEEGLAFLIRPGHPMYLRMNDNDLPIHVVEVFNCSE